MAANARRKITLTFSGDVDGEQEINASENATSPASISVHVLSAGNNTISVPSGARAVTITKSGEFTGDLVLKGLGADTGVRLNVTDPDSFSLYDGLVSFVLAADGGAGELTVRCFWS